MKLLIFAALLLTAFSCKHFPDCKPCDGKGRDTVLIYVTDSLPAKTTYAAVYNNFTPTRNVHFSMYKDWHNKTYNVSWFLWIDGEIAESSHWNTVKPADLERYKAKIMRQENERIPGLLKIWKQNWGN